MSGYVNFLVIVMLNAAVKYQTDHDETVVIVEWRRCCSGAVQI